MGRLLPTTVCSLALAGVVVATGAAAAPPSADPPARFVIGPGQEAVVRGLFPDGSALGIRSIGIESVRIVVSLAGTPAGECRAELRHPESPERDGPDWQHRRTAKFLIATSPTCPPAIVAALGERVAAGEAAFQWTEPAPPAPRGAPEPETRSPPSARALALDLRSIVWQTAATAILAGLLLTGLLLGLRSRLRELRRAEIGWLAAAALALLAILLSASWRAPYHDGDEIINWGYSLLGVFTDLRLTEYLHPTLYTYLSSLLYASYVSALSLFSGLPLGQAAARALLFHHTDLLFMSRAISALAWTATAMLAYGMGRRLKGRVAGVTAALLVFVHPLALFYASNYSPYTPSIAFSYAFLYLALFHAPRSPLGLRASVACGALAGAAFSCHGLSLFFVPAFVVALRLRRPERWGLHAGLFAAGFLTVFLVTNFRVFSDFEDYSNIWRYRLREASVPEFHWSQAGPLYYFSLVARSPLLLFGLAVAIPVLFRAVRRRDLLGAFSALFPLYLLVLLSLLSTKFNRYLLYVLPSLAVLAGVGFAALLDRLPRRSLRLVAGGLAASWAVWSGAPRVRADLEPLIGSRTSLRDGDPVRFAADWIGAHVAQDERVLVAPGGLNMFVWALRRELVSPELIDLLEKEFATRAQKQDLIFDFFDVDPQKPISTETLRSADWLYEVQWERFLSQPTRPLEGGRVLPHTERHALHGLVHAITRVTPPPPR